MDFSWFSSSVAPKAGTLFREAALAGDSEAQYCLAKELIKSGGDEEEVTHWLQQSSNNGYLPAKLLLAGRLLGDREKLDEVRELFGIFIRDFKLFVI